MQNYKRKGETINNWRNNTGADVKGGQLVAVADAVGVAVGDITAGAPGVLAMEGVFQLPKDGGEIKQGQRVYLDASGAVSAAVAQVSVGLAWEDAPAGAKTALVKINV